MTEHLVECVKYTAWLNATPEARPVQGKSKPVPERARRKDIEDAGGYVPMPDVPAAGLDLLNYFFEMGPATKDGPLDMQEVRSWAPPLTGADDWPPWQARLFVRLSREYVSMQHLASKRDCPPPWPPAVAMWRWVQNQKAERSWDREEGQAARPRSKK